MLKKRILHATLLLALLLTSCNKDDKLYTVDFYLKDTIIETQEVKSGSKVVPPKTPDGYTIDSWYTYDYDMKTPWSFSGCVVTSDLDIYANYEINKYTITYHLNGGSLSNQKTSYTVKDTVTLETPTKSGFGFLGWTGSNGEEPQTNYTQPKGSTGNKHYFANWDAYTYQIKYYLDGGTLSNLVTSYTANDYVVLGRPTKTGYTFLGWTGSNGTTPQIYYTQLKGSVGDKFYVANWQINAYTITYNLDGGSLSNQVTSYTVEDTVTLGTPTKAGYTFLGWAGSNGDTPQVNYTQPKGSTGNKTYTANWEANTYTITLDPNGGLVDTTTLSVTYDSAIPALPTPTKADCKFLYWSLSTSPTVKFAETTYKHDQNITLIANYVSKQTLTVTSNDETLGTVSIVSGTGYSGESITVQATVIGDNVFRGWYANDALISESTSYSFTMPSSTYSLTAKFITKAEEARQKALGMIPVIDTATNTVTYGLYPQTYVSDTTLTTELNKLTTTDINGWYLYNNAYYAKLTAKPYNRDYTFDDGTAIDSGTTYWFKCEPITWKIFKTSNNEYTLLSNVLLDVHRYGEYYSGTKSKTDYNGETATVYANNYKYSDIRTWLNADFYNSAFALNNSYIQTTEVDNSAYTTNSTSTTSNSYACENTNDKAYLLSHLNYNNKNYVFTSATTRACRTTDYARANGAYCSTSSSYKYNGWYWTRSPKSDYSGYASGVDDDGTLDYNYVHFAFGSVRPSITIKIA